MILIRQSAELAALPWQRKERFSEMLDSHTSILAGLYPEIPREHLAQYVHDLIVFDQGQTLFAFEEDARALAGLYEGDDRAVALRTLAKTYWIKDEVFVSHLMISPLKTSRDQKNYNELGTSFEVVHINRPAFDAFGKKIEFDFSPRPWMLKIMRHFRILRSLLPEWHKKEREIARSMRTQLLKKVDRKHLRELDNIKGYREVRYAAAEKYL